MFFKLNVPNGEGTILLKEELLLPTYAPPEIIHRDAEIKAIAWAIRPLLDGHTADNLFIYGNTGTGKTTSVRHVLSKLQETTSKVLPVRINCWEHNTQMAVYARILEALGSPLPRRGLATDEVFHRIVEVMKREEVAVLVVLDELDSLIHNREEALLYNLSRAGSNGVKFAIIGISNNKDLTL
ncbi:MAG: AAA family ATPase, partial [Candidatus Micrarchaeota archaeon]